MFRIFFFFSLVLACTTLVRAEETSVNMDTNSSHPQMIVKPLNEIDTSPPISEKVKDYVTVSRNPEIFSYILMGISTIVAIITIIVGVITGIGIIMLVKISKDKRQLESERKDLANDFDNVRKELNEEFDKMKRSLKMIAFGLGSNQKAKNDLKILLDEKHPDVTKVFLCLEKTVKYPDLECLSLYAKSLNRFYNNIDIIRVIRNGILQFSRNPRN